MKINELRKLLLSDDLYHLATTNKSNGWCGCASFSPSIDNWIKVFEGAGDGSDDKIITITKFVKNYSFGIATELMKNFNDCLIGDEEYE